MSQKSVHFSKSERIIDALTEAIRSGKYISGQAIPSINSTAQKFGVARKTVVRAYDKLKMAGLIESRPKTGYFVINRKPNTRIKVLLIIQSFDGHWEVLYNVFREKVASFCELEVFFHHYNIKLLELVISRNVADYDQIIISSFNHPRIKSVVGRIPAYKLLIISRNDRLEDSYNSIVQDFYNGTFTALCSALNRLKNYRAFHLVFPENEGLPETLKEAYVKFCSEHALKGKVLEQLEESNFRKNEAYLVITDKDLIKTINFCKTTNWRLGKDVGILSYNETPMKEVIRDGISVVSCNFEQMADEMAGFLKQPQNIQETIPIKYIKRNSL